MKYLSILLVFCLTSCVKDVDFTQAEDITITPALENNLLYFNLIAPDLLDVSNNEISSYQDHALVGFFENELAQENLIRSELFFEITNSFNREFLIAVNFYNAQDELQYTIGFNESEAVLNEPQTNEYTIIIVDNDLEAIKTTTKIEASVSLVPSTNGTVLQTTSLGRLELKSKVISYFEFNTNN